MTTMSKVRYMSMIAAVLLMMTCPGSLRAQGFQPLNGDFEQWDGSGATAEPSHWNSFATSDGTYASLASAPHHYHRHGGRPGAAGSSYLTIYTKSIMGIKANGNMTTGRIHAGSMTASGSENYNYTQRSNSDFSQPFTATPDSLYVWVSFYSQNEGSEASITAVVHGDSDFKDPNDINSPSLYAGMAKIEFGRTTTHPLLPDWQLKRVPVVYSGSATPAYLLVSLTTNKTPGSGDANDSLMIDDICFVYSSWLTDLRLNGATLEGFAQGCLEYSARVSSFDSVDIDYTAEVSDATVSVACDTVSDSVRRYTLTVTAEDGVTQHVYSLELTTEGNGQGGGAERIDDAAGLRLSVLPNPTHGVVRISAEGAMLRRVEVYDVAGRRVCSKCGTTECGEVDLSDLFSGTYVVRAVTSRGEVLATSVVKR